MIVVVVARADRLARRPAALARAASTRRVSREGAFLANNVLFAAFAFVVLLGTVFPLIVEALQDGDRISVGAPYFDRMTMPIGLALLFLMAVAPVLPWRKAIGRAAARTGCSGRRGAAPARVVRRRGRSAPAASRRCSPSASAGSPPARRSASSCWPPAARAGAASSAGPTAA